MGASDEAWCSWGGSLCPSVLAQTPSRRAESLAPGSEAIPSADGAHHLRTQQQAQTHPVERFGARTRTTGQAPNLLQPARRSSFLSTVDRRNCRALARRSGDSALQSQSLEPHAFLTLAARPPNLAPRWVGRGLCAHGISIIPGDLILKHVASPQRRPLLG
ncbi:hypothetical protein BS50DRAFT_582615 [Corynespora cassiicola Philippines]|uniref:Uncharacterized protein n=1 Tax=Corynespora cassiicola Philippines TaxID=1448308 RepID=A0A2T2P5S0_CORCC|nr:hypothetical protein BS50DRAFT_582615 [Corynespora cassiicola Philippines]